MEIPDFKFDWKIKRVNDIETNPIECWWTIGECGTLKRFYKIVPFSYQDEKGVVLSDSKYYLLYEALGIESDKASVVGVYESLDQAQKRAKFQLMNIALLIMVYCDKEKN